MAKFCSECGSLLPEKGKFCPECGAAVGVVIDAPAGSTVTVTDTPPEAAVRQIPKPAAASQNAKMQPERAARKKTEKAAKGGRRGLSLFLMLVMLVELAVAGFKYPGFLRKGKSPEASGVTDLSAITASQETETYSADVNYAQPAVQCGSVSVDLSWWNLDGDDQLVVQTAPMQNDPVTGAERYAYDISLASGKHEFSTDVVVTLPRHAGDRDKGVVMHYNDVTGVWEEVYTEISDDGRSYLVYTDHFSVFEEWVYENMFAGVGNAGTGIFREKSTEGNRMLAPVEVDKAALTEVYKGANDELAKRVLELAKSGISLDYDSRYTYTDVGDKLIGFADKGNELKMYESTLSEAGQKALGGWLSAAGYLCTALKVYYRTQAGESVGEALWDEKKEDLLPAVAAATGNPTIAFVISSIPLMNWLDEQYENLSEWSQTYIGFNNQDKLYKANVKEARYGEFFNYYDTHSIALVLGDKTFHLQADGKGWEEMFDHAFTLFAADPLQLTAALENVYTIYVNYYQNLSESERNDWYYFYCETHDNLKATTYPQSSEEMKAAYRAELTSNIKRRTLGILQARLEKSQREGVEELLTELNTTVLPLLNQKLRFTVTSSTSDEIFGNTVRGQMEPPAKFGTSGRFTEKPRLHFLDIFEPTDALFFPIGADAEDYPENAFLPAPTPDSNVVFECTWFHYLMMGMPTVMVFDSFMDDGEFYDEVIRDFKVENITGEGTLEIPLALDEFSLSFFMGDWEGTVQGMKYELSLYLHDDYISMMEDVDGDFNHGRIEIWDLDALSKTLSIPAEEDEHVAAVLKAVCWDGSGPDAIDFIVNGVTSRLTRCEDDDD